jgi:hypothetical protein
MRKYLFLAVTLLSAVFIAGLIRPMAAAEDTSKTMISILFDDGVNSSLNARQAKSQSSLAEWMKRDLVRVFGRYAKSGIEAQLIEKKQEFKAGPDNYLLMMKITDYNPGSKAARIIVGYGAGGVSLKIHYDLSANGSSMILSQDDSVFSGREWLNAARKLNQNTAKAVTEKIKGKLTK